MEIRATCAVHPLADGEVRLLGAVSVVTGAMTRVDQGGAKLLVDCGVPQGRDAHGWSLPNEARDVDAVLLTHGHQDHIGALPALLDAGYTGPIYATAATLSVARIALEDSLGVTGASDAETRRFLQAFGQQSRAVGYGKLLPLVDGRDLTARFVEAGHILGSASVDLVGPRSRVILSGDLGRPESPILRDPNTTWASGRPVDLVVCECTYGNRDHAHDAASIERELGAAIKDTLAARGKVIIPSFAIGRTQMLLYYLDGLFSSGAIPPVTVALDTPLGLAITETYDKYRPLFDKETLARLAQGDDPLDWEGLFSVERGRDSYRLVDDPGPYIVIAGSGMCQGGRIMRHLAAGLDDPQNTVLFVGYQGHGTLGRRILDAAPGERVYIDGKPIEVRAKRRQLGGLSAHADRGELCDWLAQIPNVLAVALHHGDGDAQRDFVGFANRRFAG